MTRQTPGARQDTPGFFGLGTLKRPRYKVCLYIYPLLDISITHTYTRLHFKEPYQSMNSYAVGSPPLHRHGFLQQQETNTSGGCNTDPLQSGEVCSSAFPFVSLNVSFSGAVSSTQLSAMIKGRHMGHAYVWRYVCTFNHKLVVGTLTFLHAQTIWKDTEPCFSSPLIYSSRLL